MSDADFARLLADLTRMAARLAEIDTRELGQPASAGLAADAQGDDRACLTRAPRAPPTTPRRHPLSLRLVPRACADATLLPSASGAQHLPVSLVTGKE